MADDRVTPELRLRRVLGKLPAITMTRYPGRDATLDEILDVLDPGHDPILYGELV